jgi:hypothetical protein
MAALRRAACSTSQLSSADSDCSAAANSDSTAAGEGVVQAVERVAGGEGQQNTVRGGGFGIAC